MDDRETLRAKIQSIRSRLFKYKNLKIRYHSLENSLLEAIISRGDRSVSQLIETAWKNGARFDGWTEWFKVDVWENAWTELNLAGSVSERDINAPLPWNHVDLGVDTAFLRSEWDKAKLAATTPDCREAGCTGCGICNGDIRMTFATADNLPATQTIAEPDSKDAVPYRIHSRKGAGLAFVSHLDLMRNVMRLFRASGLPVAHTQGFKPHARISLSPPLSVGVEGWNEFIDVMLTRQVPPVEIERKLYLPSGMMLLGIDEWISKEDRDLSLYKYEGVAFLPSDAMKPAFADGFRRFTEAAEWPFERERKGKLHQSDLKELVARMDWDGDCLFIVKTLQGVSVFDILETIFGIARKRSGECRIVRTALAATIKELKPVKPE
jgi:radical SAM-linked protein